MYERWCETTRCKNCWYKCCNITDCVLSSCEKFWLSSVTCVSSAVSNTFYNINKIAEELDKRKCRALPFFHALTGCNIVSSFFNQGKCKFWDWWTESQEEEALANVFMELSEKANTVTEEQIFVTERFIGFVFGPTCKFNWLRENVRLQIFIAWECTSDTTIKIRVERAYKVC